MKHRNKKKGKIEIQSIDSTSLMVEPVMQSVEQVIKLMPWSVSPTGASYYILHLLIPF